ncbi:MAG: hypothetical protein JWL90_3161 [Chthoniobacteraceae bacterium]|nr:hypothetical protein [Chthoniobacteraceae bacterium]
MKSTQSPSVQQLQRAVQIAEQIEALEQELNSLLSQSAPASAPAPAKTSQSNGSAKQAPAAKSKPAGKGKRTMSPETREKIAAAQRARWAKQKG